MKQVKTFTKRKEDFICEHCGTLVRGTGFTNHCPECLYSKHVDVFPGDRQAECGGLMSVRDIIRRGERYILVHRCTQCHHTRRDHFRVTDNMDTLIRLSQVLEREK